MLQCKRPDPAKEIEEFGSFPGISRRVFVSAEGASAGGGEGEIPTWHLRPSFLRPLRSGGEFAKLGQSRLKKTFMDFFYYAFRFEQILSFSEHGESSTATIIPAPGPLSKWVMETSDAQIFAQKKSRAKKRGALLLWEMVGGEEGREQIHLIIFLGLYRGIGFGGRHASSVNGKTIFFKKRNTLLC